MIDKIRNKKKSKRLSKGQRTHVRRLKQETQKADPTHSQLPAILHH